MHRSISLFITTLLFTSVLAAQGQPNTVDTTKVTVTDSLAQQWTTRAPLTPEERQRRADKRADLADMKKRFRRFQSEATQRQKQERTAAEEEDYLWTDAEPGGQSPAKNASTSPAPQETQPEALRMEIGRNLQEGRNFDTATVPPSPVLPTYPAAYDATSTRDPQGLQNNIKSSLQIPSTSSTDWQAKVALPSAALINPDSDLPLRAGQVILLDRVRFAPGSSQLYPEVATSLMQWAELLIAHPGLKVEVRAHTQAARDDNAALQLTQERAENIVAYWHQLGVAHGQTGYRGYGQLSPLIPANTPGAQQKNERIELIILELPTR